MLCTCHLQICDAILNSLKLLPITSSTICYISRLNFDILTLTSLYGTSLKYQCWTIRSEEDDARRLERELPMIISESKRERDREIRAGVLLSL